jgi:hypothetical protein
MSDDEGIAAALKAAENVHSSTFGGISFRVELSNNLRSLFHELHGSENVNNPKSVFDELDNNRVLSRSSPVSDCLNEETETDDTSFHKFQVDKDSAVPLFHQASPQPTIDLPLGKVSSQVLDSRDRDRQLHQQQHHQHPSAKNKHSGHQQGKRSAGPSFPPTPLPP